MVSHTLSVIDAPPPAHVAAGDLEFVYLSGKASDVVKGDWIFNALMEVQDVDHTAKHDDMPAVRWQVEGMGGVGRVVLMRDADVSFHRVVRDRIADNDGLILDERSYIESGDDVVPTSDLAAYDIVRWITDDGTQEDQLVMRAFPNGLVIFYSGIAHQSAPEIGWGYVASIKSELDREGVKPGELDPRNTTFVGAGSTESRILGDEKATRDLKDGELIHVDGHGPVSVTGVDDCGRIYGQAVMADEEFKSASVQSHPDALWGAEPAE